MQANTSAFDLPRIRAKAVANGLIPASAELAEGDIANLIFSPGFSTAAKVTNMSGRERAIDVEVGTAMPAAEVDRHIRGLSPFPGAWFEASTAKGPIRVKALLSRLSTGVGAPGQILDGEGLRVACGRSAVRLLRVQREGKGPQDAEEFLRGVAIGEQLA